MSSQVIYIDKKKNADKLVQRYTAFSAGAGWIPLPIIDSMTIAGIQLIMIKELSGLYETPFKEHWVSSLSAAFLGSIGTVSGFKFVPGAGKVIGGVSTSTIGAASTYALGKIFTQHFDQGGTLLDFDPEKSRAHFKQEFEAGKNYVLKINNNHISKNNDASKKRILKQLVSDSQKNKTALEKLQKEAQKLFKTKTRKRIKKKYSDQSNLKIIEGIGPKVEETLKKYGINIWHELSITEPKALKRILEASKGNFKLVNPESWPEQAALAEAGKFEELEILQKKLKGGRYSDKKDK